MEYLMTYGWSVLIIAVIVVALFSLGTFNASNLGPKATVGSCQVVKTIQGASLAGQCNGEVPNYVAQFDGKTSYILLPSAGFAYPKSGSINNYQLTVSAWFKTSQDGLIFAQDDGTDPNGSPSGWVPAIYIDTGGLIRTSVFWHGAVSYQVVSSGVYNTGTWHNIIDVVSNNVETTYVDGKSIGSRSDPENGYSSKYNYFIGTGYANSWPSAGSPWFYFNGLIANVQVYNTSLTQSEIQALYLEGIGGVPVEPQYIIGWWPLNGNAQDYSGNGNDGVPVSVTYNSTWMSSYYAP